MRIGIDCRMWNETGIGRYIRNIVGELAKLDNTNQYVVFLLRPEYESLTLPANFKKVCADVRWHSVKEQITLPIIFAMEKLDLLHVPHFNVPIFYPGRFVTTIHDITVLKVRTGRATTLPYPVYLLKYISAFLTYFLAIKRSAHVFTVSAFVKDEIVSTFRIKPAKVTIQRCAVDQNFYPRVESEIAAALTRYSVHQPYLFYVGNTHPHKNVERLLMAFGELVPNYPTLTLVIGGKKDFFCHRLEQESKSLPYAGKIKFIGFVDDTDLPAIYSGAEVFVNPSKYEGFGIQVLEAFGCGCKVACSNTTSLPEVGGDCAYYFDPNSASDISQRISQAMLDASEERKTCGFNRVKNFSWQESAVQIHQAYLNFAGKSKP